MLKLYIYGYLNRARSSRRLEREAHRNVNLMRLTGKLALSGRPQRRGARYPREGRLLLPAGVQAAGGTT